MSAYYEIAIRKPLTAMHCNPLIKKGYTVIECQPFATVRVSALVYNSISSADASYIIASMEYEYINQQSVEHAIMLFALRKNSSSRNKITTSGTKDDLVDRLIALHENESFPHSEWFYRLNHRTWAFLHTEKNDNFDWIWRPPVNSTDAMPTLNGLAYKIMRHLPDYTVEILNIVPKDETNDFPGPSNEHTNETVPNYVGMLAKLGRKDEVIERVLSMDCDQVKPYLQRLTKELDGIDETAPAGDHYKLNKRTLAFLRTQRCNSGGPVYEPAVNASDVNNIYDLPYIVSDDMPDNYIYLVKKAR